MSETRKALEAIIAAYDAHRDRGALPAPNEYAAFVASIQRGREVLAESAAPEAEREDGHSYGTQLRQARVQRNLSLREVAERASMTPTHLGEIERGVRSPQPAEMMAIGFALTWPARATHPESEASDAG